MTEGERRDPAMPEGYEADPEEWPCPDGPYCRAPDCVRLRAMRAFGHPWLEAIGRLARSSLPRPRSDRRR